MAKPKSDIAKPLELRMVEAIEQLYVQHKIQTQSFGQIAETAAEIKKSYEGLNEILKMIEPLRPVLEKILKEAVQDLTKEKTEISVPGNDEKNPKINEEIFPPLPPEFQGKTPSASIITLIIDGKALHKITGDVPELRKAFISMFRNFPPCEKAAYSAML